MEYQAYKPNELLKYYENYKVEGKLDNDICNFYLHFKIKEDKPKNKLNSENIDNKSTMMQLLNKLNDRTLNQALNKLRLLEINDISELDFLVNQCINKIKRENGQLKQVFAKLCWELQQNSYNVKNEKVVFRKLFLNKVKDEYTNIINFNNTDWNKKEAEQVFVLLGLLYSHKIITEAIIENIILDLKQKIIYTETMNNEYCERAIYLLISLITNIVDTSDKMFDELKLFLEEQQEIHKNQNKENQMISILIQNIIEQL